MLRDIAIMLVSGLIVSACAESSARRGPVPSLGTEDDEVDDDAQWPPPSESTTGATPEPGDETGGEGETGVVHPPPDLGACSDQSDCVLEEEGSCFAAQGTCEFGQCIFEFAPSGAACDDADACTQDDVCDDAGACLGEPVQCSVSHGHATCSDRGCGGPITCDEGWDDCDGDPDNGCETDLNADTDCGVCGRTCAPDRPHVASGSCDAGTCTFTCESPWENCNGDWSDGCEIPTGVPNQCDADGLNTDSGCWTAHCGSSLNPDAVNFGSWFCFECTTCTMPSADTCQWCSHSTGRWFPVEECACSPGDNDCECIVDGVDYLTLTCEP